MTLSEEQKELIRSLFKKGTYGVKCDSHIVGNTCLVNSLEGLEIVLNDSNLRTIVCYELSPYSNIKELLGASEMHGPYVNIKDTDRYYLITSIYKIGEDDCRVALEGNHKGNLNFNCMLMLFPDEVIDYVVVHELAHLLHHNHGPEFYRTVEQYLPDWRQRAKLLKY